MPRIPAVPESEAGVLGRTVYRVARRVLGQVPVPLAVLRHHPRLFWTSPLTDGVELCSGGALPAGLGELAEHRTAARVACSWCVDFSALLATRGGTDPERLRRARAQEAPEDPGFSGTERLVLRYADAVTATPGTVTDDLVAALESRLGRAGVVELTHRVALENMRARFNDALGIGSQGYCEVIPAASRG